MKSGCGERLRCAGGSSTALTWRPHVMGLNSRGTTAAVVHVDLSDIRATLGSSRGAGSPPSTARRVPAAPLSSPASRLPHLLASAFAGG